MIKLIDFPVNFKRSGSDIEVLEGQSAVLEAIKNIIKVDKILFSDDTVNIKHYQHKLKTQYNGLVFVRKIKSKIEKLSQVLSAEVGMNMDKPDDINVNVVLNSGVEFNNIINI